MNEQKRIIRIVLICLCFVFPYAIWMTCKPYLLLNYYVLSFSGLKEVKPSHVPPVFYMMTGKRLPLDAHGLRAYVRGGLGGASITLRFTASDLDIDQFVNTFQEKITSKVVIDSNSIDELRWTDDQYPFEGIPNFTSESPLYDPSIFTLGYRVEGESFVIVVDETRRTLYMFYMDIGG